MNLIKHPPKTKRDIFILTGKAVCRKHGLHSDWIDYVKHSTVSCRHCCKLNKKAYRERDPERNRLQQKAWKQKTLAKERLKAARSRAKLFGRQYDPTLSTSTLQIMLIKQNFKCALTSRPLNTDFSNVSIDRINSTQGYTPDNIQLVIPEINIAKKDHTLEYFIQLCIDVWKTHGSK